MSEGEVSSVLAVLHTVNERLDGMGKSFDRRLGSMEKSLRDVHHDIGSLQRRGDDASRERQEIKSDVAVARKTGEQNSKDLNVIKAKMRINKARWAARVGTAGLIGTVAAGLAHWLGVDFEKIKAILRGLSQ